MIVLKQFSVLATDRGCNLHVTITPNNLVAIYSNDTTCIGNISNVNVTVIQEFSVGDFIKNINEVKARHKSAERLKSILGFSETNINVQKAQIQHVSNNKFSTPMKSRSSSDITVKCSPRNIQNVTTSSRNIVTTNSPISPSLNRTPSESNVSSCSSKAKFNFKALKCNNIKTIELVSKNKDIASKNLIKNTQISIVTNDSMENNMILENVFEGVDADLLFEDF